MDDADTFRALYRAHYRAVCRYLAARTDADAVEDVAAETFVVAWRRLGDVPEHERPWLLATAAKCLANHRRSRERSGRLAERLGAVAATPAADAVGDALERAGQRRALLIALASLGERDRELLLLAHWDGLAPRDVAVVAGCSPVAARARLHRASRRLQRALTAALADPEPRRGTAGLTHVA
ncbi:MAG TPA: sigma-70 family RNA polymerase sigma factor [Solirubrobacteraceae bacterium]|jgi:RNA polymerase sigma-70 factor (ECF subfamily)|nr:sigma-70 family RNA polymerase sigma factor [Solirubrobacteraceae bacterium]